LNPEQFRQALSLIARTARWPREWVVRAARASQRH
jgi:hypothetical protein